MNQWKKLRKKKKKKKLQQRIRYCCLVYILTVWVNCRFGNLSFTTTFEQHRNCNFFVFCCKMNINAFHSFVHIPFIHWKKSNICFVFVFSTLWLMKHTYSVYVHIYICGCWRLSDVLFHSIKNLLLWPTYSFIIFYVSLVEMEKSGRVHVTTSTQIPIPSWASESII